LQHSPSQIYIWDLQLVTRYTNIILESGLWVELGCDLLHETNEVDGSGLQTRAHKQRAGWETYLSPPLGSVLL
jgi:hypothetical protein